MKNFDLNSFGVQELDAKTINKTNGGSLLLLALFVAVAIYCACDGDPNTSTTINGQRVGK